MSTINAINATNTTDQIEYVQNPQTTENDETNTNETDFADVLSEAIRDLTTSPAVYSDVDNMAGSFLPLPAMGNTLEQAIMTATSTGKSDDAMMALMLLMMMMQSGGMGGSGGGGGEMTMMMQMMATMIGQMQEKTAIRDNFMYSSGGEPYTLDAIDAQIFGNTIDIPRYENEIPDVTDSEEAILPLEWWRPTTPVIVSTKENRSAELYRAVVDQFNVETAERYRPGRQGYTFCNVYVWDVTRAMGATVPYYSDPVTGAPREYPAGRDAKVNGAIAMDGWLRKYGQYYGWREVTPEEAQMHANQGKPAVTAAGDIGHVQMIVPSEDGSYDPIRGVTIAQAGSKVSNYTHISSIYGSKTRNEKVSYWVHD